MFVIETLNEKMDRREDKRRKMMITVHTDDDEDNRDSPSPRRTMYNCARVPSGDRRGQSVYVYLLPAACVRTPLDVRAAGSNSECDCPILNFRSVQSVGHPGPFVCDPETVYI